MAKRVLDAWSAQSALRDVVPFVPSILTRDVEEALSFARDYGYPVVLKAVSDQIVHKTDAGAVVLNVSDDDALLHHFYSLQRTFNAPILVQKQVSGVELFLGGKQDPQFGPVVLFGLGGIFVEVYKDVSARVAPFSPEEARTMFLDLRGKEILEGARGVRVNLDALASIVSRFSEFLAQHPEYLEVDLNPIFATRDGIYAVDARIVLRGS